MISKDRRLVILTELRELTEALLQAALSLQSKTMEELNIRRSDLLFNLQVALQTPLPEDLDLREAMMEEATALNRLETRLSHVAGLVLETFEHLAPHHPVSTYGASGHLTG